MGPFLQHFHAGIQYRLISPEFIDDHSFHHLLLIRLQEHDRSHQLGKNTSTVNIAHQQYRSFGHFGHAHVDNIFFLQIDLRRTSGSFDHNNIIFFRQCLICFHNFWHQLLFIFKVISGTHSSQDFSVYDDLAAYVIGRFQQDGVHQHRRTDPCGLRLHDLCSSHLQAFLGDKRIQRHILRFKRGHLVSVLFKDPAQACCQQTLPCIGHSPLYHNCFCHNHSLFCFICFGLISP